jgi:L,D-peptidoglycan transpeptidase YkuD (ErfK/YbiS/YcfS/YnhG family)
VVIPPAAAVEAASPGAIPESAQQLIVVSAVVSVPARSIATFRTYDRAGPSAAWHQIRPAIPAEIGGAGLASNRVEGDRTTPTGVYAIGAEIYGNDPRPVGLHLPYHRLVCGDWWDEDRYSAQYNTFVHVPCGTTPPFASESEALWTETAAYPYFAVIEFNVDPILGGRDAPGSGIFLHAWVGGPTNGCVAVPLGDLLATLRWLDPHKHPVIEIGTASALAPLSRSPS